MILAGTGHRPPKLGLGYAEADRKLLVAFATEQVSRISGVTGLISGMAQGWDQALAEAAIALSLPLTAAVAFPDMHIRWPRDGRRRYEDILAKAARVVEVCGPGYEPGKFAERDCWMVDNCDTLVALFDDAEARSGTGITVRYASHLGVPIINLWETWLAYRGI